MLRRCLSYARGAWGSHTRDATVYYHPKEVVYDIPIYNEPRGTLKSVTTEKDRIILIYQQHLQTSNQNFYPISLDTNTLSKFIVSTSLPTCK